MKQTAHTALFCSLLLGMGMLFGVFISFFAREYANEVLAQSRRQRHDDDDPTPPGGNMLYYDKMVN